MKISIWPFSLIKFQKSEIERLQGLITKQLNGELTLEDLKVGNDSLDLTLSGNPIHIFADAFSEYFFASKAKNFITMEFYHRKSGEKFEVTMQKSSGESVCDQLKRLKFENDSFRGDVCQK